MFGRLAGGNLRVLNRKGGDNVAKIIKLAKALTELIRALADLVRAFKA